MINLGSLWPQSITDTHSLASVNFNCLGYDTCTSIRLDVEYKCTAPTHHALFISMKQLKVLDTPADYTSQPNDHFTKAKVKAESKNEIMLPSLFYDAKASPSYKLTTYQSTSPAYNPNNDQKQSTAKSYKMNVADD